MESQIVKTADYLLNLVHSCLIECEMDCSIDGKKIDFFFSHSRPPDDCCDYLAIWVNRIRPVVAGEFPFSTDRLLRNCEPLGLMVEYMFTFRRSCFPIVNDETWFPSPSEIDAMSKSMMLYGHKIMCCIISAWENKELTGLLSPGSPEIEGVAFDDMYPREPRGGCAGWDMKLVVEIGKCCEGC